MLLICVDKAAESFEVFTEQPGFAVNILAETQVETSGLFASKRADKFDIAQWSESPTGNPILAGVCAWFDCSREQVIDAGDHVIILGRILSYENNDSIGLGYVRGGYMSLEMERSAARAASGPGVIVGAVVEHEGKILLMTNPETNELYVPASGLDGTTGSLNKLQRYLDDLNIGITISSLFAVFEYEETGQQAIYYRAKAESDQVEGSFIPFKAIPWDRVNSPPHVTMLKRYIDESARQRYGIYFGSDRDGEVEVLW